MSCAISSTKHSIEFMNYYQSVTFHTHFYILSLPWNDVALKDAFTFYVYSKVSRYLTSTGRPIHYR